MEGGFPSRWIYVRDKLKGLNGTDKLSGVIELALAPVRFLNSSLDHAAAIDYVNKYLDFDGYRVAMQGKRCKLQPTNEIIVESESIFLIVNPLSHEFIQEQVQKCDTKVSSGDYDGAITNARSLVEAVLYEIEGRLQEDHPAYDGDLQKLYKRVQKLLNLDPEMNSVSESLKTILRGLTNIIAGLAPLRNKMGDAHVRTYKPERHHAKLAVNSAKTLSDFIIDSFDYQIRTGRLSGQPR